MLRETSTDFVQGAASKSMGICSKRRETALALRAFGKLSHQQGTRRAPNMCVKLDRLAFVLGVLHTYLACLSVPKPRSGMSKLMGKSGMAEPPRAIKITCCTPRQLRPLQLCKKLKAMNENKVCWMGGAPA